MRNLIRALRAGGVRVWTSVGVACGLLLLAVLLMANDSAMAEVQRAFAWITSGILNLLGHPTVAEGNVVFSSSFGISVVTACTGLFATLLFVMAVVVFPTTWVARLVGALIGVVGLFVVNVIRLVTLYYVGVHWSGALDTIHLLVWQSLVIVIAVSLWLLWAGRVAVVRGRGAGR